MKNNMKEFVYKNDNVRKISKLSNDDIANLVKEKIGTKNISGFESTIYSKPNVIYDNLNKEAITHNNYLNYLELTYDRDYGAIIKPDFIWYTILCEMSRIIKNDVDIFQKYFTTSKEKELIVTTSCDNNYELNINNIYDQLLEKIPIGLTDNLICPKFTTVTKDSKFAFRSAFLDAMKVYYNYGYWCCGYNKVKIYGEISDYKLMISTLEKISTLITELKEYFDQCILMLNTIITKWDDSDFWKDICKTEYGYAQHDVDGWFINFFWNICRGSYNTPSQSSFPEHISKISYKDISSGTEYIMYVGILSSTIYDGCLVPHFNKIIVQK